MLAYVKKTISKEYMKLFLKNEEIFHFNTCNVKYVFKENRNSDKLLVIFSGFPPKGKPPVYNYVLKFRNLNCNKLFILDDFGDDVRGSYYLGTDGEWYVIDAVTSLIKKIATASNIDKKNITCTGSSKGAFASLFYGIRNGYGNVIAGEPQIFVADYLRQPDHLSIFQSIVGEASDENTKRLNGVLFDLVEESDMFPSITIHCGKDGYHHREHIKPFLEKLDSKGVSYSIDLGNYSDHSDVGVYYPPLVFKHFAKQ